MMTGAELRAIRRRAGLTQLEFARRLSVGQAHISDCERGYRPVLPYLADRALAIALPPPPPSICGRCLCWSPPGSGLECGCPE